MVTVSWESFMRKETSFILPICFDIDEHFSSALRFRMPELGDWLRGGGGYGRRGG